MKTIPKIISIQRWSLAVILFLAIQSHAWAHAFLDHAEPRVGSTVAHSPAEVKLWFTQEVEPAFSSVQVQDTQGQPVDKKDMHVDAQNKSLLIVSVPQLAPGTYTVNWQVVSVDTHRTHGRFQFVIKSGQ